MIVSHKYKFIFFHNPKTGGSSISYGLKDYIDNKNIKKLKNIDQNKRGWQGYLHTDMMHKKMSDFDYSKYDHYFKFAFVRNPYDRLVSFFAKRNSGPLHFKFKSFNLFLLNEFIYLYKKKDPNVICQSELLNKKLDFIGRFENLNSDIKKINKHLGINIKLKKILVNPNRKKYITYYNPLSKFIIQKIYSNDLSKFKYKF